MRNLAVLSLPLLAGAASISGATLDKRQFDLLGLGLKPKAMKPMAVNKLIPQFRDQKDAIREQLIYGPFPVQPSNGTHAKGFFKLDPNSDVLNAQIEGLCQGCMVLAAKSDIALKDGSKADIGNMGVYSHHVIMTVMGRPMAPTPVIPGMCPDGKMGGFNFGDVLGGSKGMGGMGHGHSGSMKNKKSKRQFQLPKGIDMSLISKFMPKFSVFMGQGEDSSGLVFADPTNSIKSGFYLGGGDNMNMMAEVVNYDPKAKEVYVTLDYEYLPNMPTRPTDYYQVGMNAINVDPCGAQKLYPSTEHAVKYSSPPWNVIADGYLLDVKPHMHDGGINMTFSVNGKSACVSRAIYGGTEGGKEVNGEKWETITAYEPCRDPIKVSKGDKLTMEAWYDLTQHKLRPMSVDDGEQGEGMALALFVGAVPWTS